METWHAEIGELWPQAKACWQAPEVGGGKEQIIPRVSRGGVALLLL